MDQEQYILEVNCVGESTLNVPGYYNFWKDLLIISYRFFLSKILINYSLKNVKMMRLGTGSYPCNRYHYEGTHKHDLKHLKSMKSNEGVKFPCDQCDYKTTRKNSLMTHIKSRHEGVKFPCDQCDYKATLKRNLLTHIESLHKGITFACDQCEYKATYKNALLKHQKRKHNVSLVI